MRPDDPRVLTVAAAIVALIDACASRREDGRGPEPSHYYSDRRRGAAPPGLSYRSFRSRARDMGAQKLGAGWVISREAFERWAAARSAPPRATSNVVAGPWSPASALAAAGARSTQRKHKERS